jgi:isoleucyl-tRNA synthetase
VQTGRDWSLTLFLPKTDFPMKAGLPEREPELLKRWREMNLYGLLRAVQGAVRNSSCMMDRLTPMATSISGLA